KKVASLALDPRKIPRRSSQISLVTGDEMLRVFFHPGVIEPHMVGDKIEHQSQAALTQSFAQPEKRLISPKFFVHGISGDRKTRAGDVFLSQVRQRLLELTAPLRIRSRDSLRRQTRLPNAKEPDPVESHLDEAIE